MFASDRDIVMLDPDLFRDIGWAGQRLVKGVGDVSGTTLTLTSQDNTFAMAGVGAGNVVTVEGVAYEVIARLSATALTISRIRSRPDDVVIPPTPVTGKAVAVFTFAPQISMVHRDILRLLDIDTEEGGYGVKESDITNPGAFREAEAMGALSLVLFSSTSPVSADPGASVRLGRAAAWRETYAGALRRIGAHIDTDGDGVPDATRYAGFAMLERA